MNHSRSFASAACMCGVLFTSGQMTQGCLILNAGDSEVGRGVVQTADGGYIVAGEDNLFGPVDMLAMKVDAAGAFEWGTRLSAINSDYVDYCYGLALSADGGCVLAGHTGLPSDQDDMLLVKLDAAGVVVWARTYGTLSHSEAANDVIATSDGGFLMAGLRWDLLGYSDPYVVKVNATGDLQWATDLDYGGVIDATPTGAVEAPDGGFVVSAYSVSIGAPFFKLDEDGELVWSRMNSPTQGGGFFAVTNTSDGNHVLAGGSLTVGGSNMEMCLVKIDPDGEMIWQQIVIGSNATDYAYSVVETPDDGLVMAGALDEFGNSRQYLAKVDADGALLWTRVIGNDAQRGFGLVATSDGGLVTTGQHQVPPGNIILTRTNAQGMPCDLCGIDSIGVPGTGTALTTAAATASHPGSGASITVTTTSLGSVTPICSPNGVEEQATIRGVTIIPQPMHDAAQVIMPDGWLAGTVHFLLRDVTGRVVRSLPVITPTFTLHRGHLPAGLYTYEVHSRSQALSGKVIID